MSNKDYTEWRGKITSDMNGQIFFPFLLPSGLLLGLHTWHFHSWRPFFPLLTSQWGDREAEIKRDTEIETAALLHHLWSSPLQLLPSGGCEAWTWVFRHVLYWVSHLLVSGEIFLTEMLGPITFIYLFLIFWDRTLFIDFPPQFRREYLFVKKC